MREPGDRFAELGRALAAGGEVVVRERPFRSPALTVGGKIFAMLVEERLVLKLPAARCTELVRSARAQPFLSGKRVMREWVVLADDADWAPLTAEALEYVRR